MKSIQQLRKWVSATDTRNYILKDKVVDWLRLYRSSEKKNDPFLSFLYKRGVEFEHDIIKKIRLMKIGDVKACSPFFSQRNVQKTLGYMRSGTPIIHSASLHNPINNTYGVADLLVRSDVVNKMYRLYQAPLTEEEEKAGSDLHTDFHYIVMDIKNSTLHLRGDNRTLKDRKNIPAYKSQVLVYNLALEYMQGYLPPRSYIIGRRIRSTQSTTTYTPFDILGEIDWTGIDKRYRMLTDEAIEWVKNVNENGNTWTVMDPKLCPNMNVDNSEWQESKTKLCDERGGEITSLWNCGLKHRQKAHDQDILSWRDKRFNSSVIGMNGKRGRVIDQIVDSNRESKIQKIEPMSIKNNMYNWKTPCNEIFVDFETTCFSNQGEDPFIFMVGIGEKLHNGSWHYTNFTCDSLDREEEKRVLDSFIEFIKRRSYPKMYFWFAETAIMKKAYERWPELQSIDSESWADLHKLFMKEPITVPGCLNFSLKNIVSSMNDLDMIPTSLSSRCESGASAIAMAHEYYETKNREIFADLVDYNNFDCRALSDILTYLRKHHQ